LLDAIPAINEADLEHAIEVFSEAERDHVNKISELETTQDSLETELKQARVKINSLNYELLSDVQNENIKRLKSDIFLLRRDYKIQTDEFNHLQNHFAELATNYKTLQEKFKTWTIVGTEHE
jgi:predicted  nucleic acid-binding Zn-ribbon protein